MLKIVIIIVYRRILLFEHKSFNNAHPFSISRHTHTYTQHTIMVDIYNPTHTYTHKHTPTHTHIHTSTHTHTHTCNPIHSSHKSYTDTIKNPISGRYRALYYLGCATRRLSLRVEWAKQENNCKERYFIFLL